MFTSLLPRTIAVGTLLGLTLTAHAAVDRCAPPDHAALFNPAGLQVGTLWTSNDRNAVRIHFATRASVDVPDVPWQITGTKSHAALTLAGIPKNKPGNPVLGQFAFKTAHVPPVSDVTYEVRSLPGPNIRDTIVIAAYAELTRTVNGVVQTTTAWAAGPSFPGHSGATYTVYEIKDMVPFPQLPTSITFQAHHPGETYWQHTVRSCIYPANQWQDIDCIPYDAWCCEQNVFMNDGGIYTGTPRDTLALPATDPNDPNKPYRFANPHWDQVNYLINHIRSSSGALLYSRDDIQNAIWFLLVNNSVSLSETAQTLVTNARNHGNGYVPGEGELLGIVIEIPGVQGTIIEVEVELTWPGNG